MDLTPPPEVINYRNGLHQGGAQAGGAGPGTGGTGAAGGVVDGGGDASIVVASGGFTGGSGGAVTTGGATSTSLPSAGGSTGIDASPGLGGASGGGAGRDAASKGGSPGTGGVVVDAGGAGGDDASIASGGTVSTGGTRASGGTTSSGGTTGSGGATVSSGGKTGTGGTTTSTGGTTTSTGGVPTAYNCASALAPSNGVITDFSTWNATSGIWTTGALSGNIYQYSASPATMNAAKVEGTPPGLHLNGSVPSSYAGGGLTFYSCLTVASFTKISFDVYGSASNCSIELQLQTYDQRPVEQTPPGTCKGDGGTSCFKFPAKSQVVSLANTVAAPGTTVSVALSSFTNWSTAAANQIVGMQWQFTSSGGTCTPNATFTNIKFVP